jgi:hypothetical protein
MNPITRTRRFLPAAFTLFISPAAFAVGIPIPVTGFNQDIVVEGAAINDPTTHYSNNVTATMDSGIVKTGNTWYQTGLNLTAPTTGLLMGVPLPAQADPTVTFQLSPATTNNALVVDVANPNGNIDFVTPLRLSKLYIITSSGNGNTLDARLGLQFTDLAPGIDTTYTSRDWFGNTPIAFTASGRVVPSTGAFDAVGSDNPRLYYHTIDLAALGAQNRELFRLNIAFNGGPTSNTHTAIMAISGEVVPEPTTLATLTLAAAAFLTRRRRN